RAHRHANDVRVPKRPVKDLLQPLNWGIGVAESLEVGKKVLGLKAFAVKSYAAVDLTADHRLFLTEGRREAGVVAVGAAAGGHFAVDVRACHAGINRDFVDLM